MEPTIWDQLFETHHNHHFYHDITKANDKICIQLQGRKKVSLRFCWWGKLYKHIEQRELDTTGTTKAINM